MEINPLTEENAETLKPETLKLPLFPIPMHSNPTPTMKNSTTSCGWAGKSPLNSFATQVSHLCYNLVKSVLGIGKTSQLYKVGLLSLAFLASTAGSSSAQIWINSITTGSQGTKYLGDKLADPTNIRFEIGQTSWNAARVGIGTSNSTSAAYTFITANWYADTGGSNKGVQANLWNYQFVATGNHYLLYQAKANSGDAYTQTSGGGWGNSTGWPTLSAYYAVQALGDPTGQTATAASGTQINLSWTKWSGRNVMIVRSADASFTAPTQGIGYAVSSTIGGDTVIYNGDATSCSDTGLTAGTTYYYKFYSENWSYYSSGVTASATTTASSTPTITINGGNATTATAFSTTYGTASANQTFTIAGGNLTANITATAPTGFEVSSDGTTYGSTANFAQSGGSASGTLRVRLAATAATTGSYNSLTVNMTSTGATTRAITTASSGNTVSKKALTITAAAQTIEYGTPIATLTGAGSYTPTGFANGETAAVIGGTASYSTNYTQGTAAGTGGVTITPVTTALTATNYSFSAATGAVTIGALSNPSSPSATAGAVYTATQMALAWTKWNSKDVLLVRNTADSFTSPTQGIVYSAGNTIGTGTVVYKGSGTSVSDDGRMPGTTYYYKIYSENYGYYSSNPSTFSGTTAMVQARNTSGSTPQAPAGTIYLGDTGKTFGLDSWGSIGFNGEGSPAWGKARLVVRQGNADLSGGTASAYGDYVNVENKTITSGTFNATGTWYWGMQMDYGAVYGASYWYKSSSTAWTNMSTDGTGSTLSFTVTALNNPSDFTATANSTTQINLAWTAGTSGDAKETLVLRKTSAITTDPTQGVTYNATDTIDGATVLYRGSATTFNDTGLTAGTTYYYKIYSENWSYYSSGTTATASSLPNAPVVTATTYNGTVGVAFSQTINATNAPTSYSITGSLPGGLSLNTTTGLMSGTPTTAVTGATVSANATNAGGASSPATLTFNIAKGSSTISVTGSTSFTYSGSPQGPSSSDVTGSTGEVTYSYVGVSGTTYGPSATKPTSAGSYTATASVAADSNYNTATSSATAFSIGKANSTISVTGSTSFTYNASPQGPTTSDVTGSTGAVTYSYEGAEGTVYEASATLPTNVGNYTATASVAADSNYNAASSSATAFSINAASQTITFGALSAVTYGDLPFDLTATASSSLEVSYASSNTSVATVSGNTVTVVAPGTTTITASQAGNANYAAASDVPQSLTVSTKALTLSDPAVTTKTYDGTTAATITGTLSGKVGADTVTFIGTGSFNNATVGTEKPVTAAITLGGAQAARYTMTQPEGLTGEITQATATISEAPTATTITSGQALSDSTLSGGTASVAGSFAFTSPATVPSPGNYSANVTFTPTDATNYTTATTDVTVGVLCLAPTLTRATSPSATGFTVNWADVAGETGYQIEHSANQNMSSSTTINASVNATSQGITELVEGIRYVRVRAMNAAGASANSTVQINQLTSVPANTTKYLSVASSPASFTVAGIFGAADEAGLAANVAYGSATQILLLGSNGSTAYTIHYNGSGWYDGVTESADVAIPVGQAFMLKNNTAAIDYILLVGTPRDPEVHPTVTLSSAGNYTLVTTGRTEPTALTALNLDPGTSAGQFKAAAKPTAGDRLVVPPADPTQAVTTYWYRTSDGAWYDGLRPVPAASIPAGAGFFIKKASDSTFDTWTLPDE
jgi:hypothetical protein